MIDRSSAIIIVFWFVGLIYLYIGYKYVRNKKSQLSRGNLFRKSTMYYSGKVAIFHGLSFMFIGLFTCILGTAIILNIISPNLAVMGCVFIPASTLLAVGIVSVLGNPLKSKNEFGEGSR